MTARAETSSRLPVPLNALKNIILFLLKSPTSAFGLAVLLLLVIAAIFAPWLATHDPYAQDLANTLQARATAMSSARMSWDAIFTVVFSGARASRSPSSRWSRSSSAPSVFWSARHPVISAASSIR